MKTKYETLEAMKEAFCEAIKEAKTTLELFGTIELMKYTCLAVKSGVKIENGNGII